MKDYFLRDGGKLKKFGHKKTLEKRFKVSFELKNIFKLTPKLLKSNFGLSFEKKNNSCNFYTSGDLL